MKYKQVDKTRKDHRKTYLNICFWTESDGKKDAFEKCQVKEDIKGAVLQVQSSTYVRYQPDVLFPTLQY